MTVAITPIPNATNEEITALVQTYGGSAVEYYGGIAYTWNSWARSFLCRNLGLFVHDGGDTNYLLQAEKAEFAIIIEPYVRKPGKRPFSSYVHDYAFPVVRGL